MRILSAEATDLFVGSGDRTLQLIRVALRVEEPQRVNVAITGADVEVCEEQTVWCWPGRSCQVDVGVGFTTPTGPGSHVEVTVTAESRLALSEHRASVRIAEPGCRVFLVPHFHWDAVFWNTQDAYTESWQTTGLEWEDPFQLPGFDALRSHIDRATSDSDYAFSLECVDLVKAYWDSFPEERERIRSLLAEGQLELVCGGYNEPDTNLSSIETLVRNLVYGRAYARDVFGVEPRVWWQADVFGHAPSTPSLAAAADLDAVVFARGPHHPWGPWWYKHADITYPPPGSVEAGSPPPAMEVPSEFRWVGPDGAAATGIYLPLHYHCGWWIERAADIDQACEYLYGLFATLQPHAASPNVFVPVGTDFTPANRWLPELVREWNRRYVSPKLVCATPSEYVAALNEATAADSTRLTPQTRDLNPVFAGTYISAITAKQAHRACENTLSAAETFATIAAVLGNEYTHATLDRAWRILLFGSHHDAVTGSHSDLVNLDLLALWREALERASATLDAALQSISERINTRVSTTAIAVFNPTSWTRTDVARIQIEPPSGTHSIELRDGEERIPFTAENVQRDSGGSITTLELVFVAADVPAVGYRTFDLSFSDSGSTNENEWTTSPSRSIASQHFEVDVDPDQGGTLTRITEKGTGGELLRSGGLGNELVAWTQYPDHPRFEGEGLWHIKSTGEAVGSKDASADVSVQTSAAGARIVVEGPFGGGHRRQVTTLWHGMPRVEFSTQLDDIGADQLVRTQFGFAAPGAVPLSDTAGAVITRGFGLPKADAFEIAHALDFPASSWAGLCRTAAIAFADPQAPLDPPRRFRVLEPVEIIAADPATAEPLAAALVQQGVTATVTRPGGPRAGCMDVDSSSIGLRIGLDQASDNSFVAAALELDTAARTDLTQQLNSEGRGRTWLPGTEPPDDSDGGWRDRRAITALPVLVIGGADAESLVAEIGDAVVELSTTSCMLVRAPAGTAADASNAPGAGIALLNRGTPAHIAERDGTLAMALLDTTCCWPHGLWPRDTRVTYADGEELDPFAHTHRFDYALVAAAGNPDWRAAGFATSAKAWNQPFAAKLIRRGGAELPASLSFVSVEPSNVVLEALKPAGNPVTPQTHASTETITARVHELNGIPTTATVHFPTPLLGAQHVDIHEQPVSDCVTDRATASLVVAANGLGTINAKLEPARNDREPLTRHTDPQPMYARHWRHSDGPAPLGGQPLSIRAFPEHVCGDGPFEFEVTVAPSSTRPVSGEVEIVAPAGWLAEPARVPFTITGGDWERHPVRVTPVAGDRPGRTFIAARVRDELGQEHEDIVRVDAGLEHPDAEVSIELVTPTVVVTAPEAGELDFEVRNLTDGVIRGRAQLVSPYGTWSLLTPGSHSLQLAPRERVTLRFTAHPDTAPFSSWAVLKLSWFGRQLLSQAVAIEWAPRGPGTPEDRFSKRTSGSTSGID